MASDAQREAALEAVAEAAQGLISWVTWGNPHTVTVDAQRAYKLNRALTALRTLDALQAEPPASEDAEPELPPRSLPDAATVAQWQREAGDGMG